MATTESLQLLFLASVISEWWLVEGIRHNNFWESHYPPVGGHEQSDMVRQQLLPLLVEEEAELGWKKGEFESIFLSKYNFTGRAILTVIWMWWLQVFKKMYNQHDAKYRALICNLIGLRQRKELKMFNLLLTARLSERTLILWRLKHWA